MRAVTRAALAGAATGLRTSVGLGALIASDEPGLPRALRNGPAHVLAGLAIASELVIDKLPSTPSRLERRGLTGRFVAAAAAGAAIARGSDQPVLRSAAVAAGAALLSARVGHDVREVLSRTHPAVKIAAAEDAVALRLASIAA